MNGDITRRELIGAVGASAAASAQIYTGSMPGPRAERPDTPKICLEMGRGGLAAGDFTEAGCRRLKQIGVEYALSGGPRIPWTEEGLRDLIGRCKAGGITLANL